MTTPVVGGFHRTLARLMCTVAAVTLLVVTAGPAFADKEPAPDADPAIKQTMYASPELAAQALTDALDTEDREALKKMFGEKYADLLPLDPIGRGNVDKYLALYAEHHELIPEDEQEFMLAIGKNYWTFPVPIVEGDRGWHFDTDAGIEQVRIRQIGRDELATIQASLAYYDAQVEYAEQDRNGDGVLEYAQKFLSTPGEHDGLYWETQPGETESPLGPLFADNDLPDGAYHGYHYRILTSQGRDAPGGAYNYVIGGRMIAGFALIAWPAEYGETGIMSFMVSHEGVVYQKDLGPESATEAEAMSSFDPGPGWVPVPETDDTPAGAGQG